MIERILESVDRARIVTSLAEMVAIPSVNPFDDAPRAGKRELEFADYFQTRMDDLGLETSRREVVPDRPNVWGVLSGTGDGRSLMLAGHMDTVGVDNYEHPFAPYQESGRLHGRGSCDMKAALAAFLETAQVLVDHKIDLAGDLIIAGLIDEEHLMLGSKDIGVNGPKADFGVVGEPTNLAVCPAHKGQTTMIIRTLGKAVHSSMPELGENAIVRMARVIAAFDGYNEELMKGDAHPLCGHGRFSAGVIKGGTISSAVPDVCELEVDRRLLPNESTEQVIARYRERLDPLTADDPGFRYELVGPRMNSPALDLDPDMPAVRTLIDAVSAELGQPAVVEAFPGGTDAPNLGFPCAVCGPGSLAQAHTVNEFVDIDQIVAAARIYLRVCLSDNRS